MTMAFWAVRKLHFGQNVVEPAADSVPGMLLVEVPRYPGAVATTETQDSPFFYYPATPYLKSAFAAFLLPAKGDVLEAWYRSAMPEAGFEQNGDGRTSLHGETQSAGMTFRSLNHRGLEIFLSFQVKPSLGTHILYLATAVTLPPRPNESYLPPDIVRLHVTHMGPMHGPPPPTRRTSRFVVDDPAMIQAVVGEINSIADIAAGVSSGLDRGESATLV
jgi:hypothetical protein